MFNELVSLLSADAIVICNDFQSGHDHIALQHHADGCFTLLHVLSSFDSPNHVESTIVHTTDFLLLVFFDPVLQQTMCSDGIYVFIGLNNNNNPVDLHPEHHLMTVALTMDKQVLPSSFTSSTHMCIQT